MSQVASYYFSGFLLNKQHDTSEYYSVEEIKKIYSKSSTDMQVACSLTAWKLDQKIPDGRWRAKKWKGRSAEETARPFYSNHHLFTVRHHPFNTIRANFLFAVAVILFLLRKEAIKHLYFLQIYKFPPLFSSFIWEHHATILWRREPFLALLTCIFSVFKQLCNRLNRYFYLFFSVINSLRVL